MPLHGFRSIVAAATCTVCVAGALVNAQRPAQPPQPQTTFRSSIELVQIDAVVVDDQGRHVRGLTAKDFRIFDRGKPQAVAAFEEVTHHRAEAAASATPLPLTVRADVASNQNAQSDRLVVMVVDDLHIWRGRTDTARTIARDVLSKLGRDASMAVLFTSGDHTTEVTDDPSRLLAAVDTLEGRQPVRRPNQAINAQTPGGIDPEMSSAQALAVVQTTQSISLRHFADNMQLFRTIEDAAWLLGAGTASRKAFVLLSEGMARNPVGIFETMSPPPGWGPQYHETALLAMMEAMHRSNIATYAIDPRGEVTSRELGLESHPEPLDGDPTFRWHNPVRMAQDGLATIAEASGGFAVVNTDDFTSGVDDIIEDLDHYYLLGFYPADTKGDHFRPVRVEVPGHPGWTVRFRKGYVPQPEDKGEKDSKEPNPLVALSSGVLPSRDLPLRLAAIPLSASGKDTDVALALEVTVPRVALEDEDRRLRDEVSYEVLVVDENKNRVRSGGGRTGRITLTPREGADGQPPDTVTYQVADRITLRPGTYQLRVSARSTKLGTGGSVYLNLDVPDFTTSRPVLSGLAIGYAAGPRVPSASTSPTSPSGRTPASMRTVTLPFPQTLDRTFAASDTLRVYFEVGGRDGMADVTGTLEILDPGRTTVHASIPFAPNADGSVDLRLPLTGLQPGAHILRATVTAGEHSATREIGLLIRP